jgi:CheY-like chemotaxis protein
MSKQLLEVGNCEADHATLTAFLTEHFDVVVTRCHGVDDARQALEQTTFDLIAVNRRLDRDGRDGLELIRAVKADPRWCRTPVLMISNSPEAQDRARNAGAVPGFGKANLHSIGTVRILEPYLR